MKVTTKSGGVYTKDHPHEIISPQVMRFDEIREWLRELSTNPAYGWTPGGRKGLERALGMGENGIPNKLNNGGWIWPKEQVRLTARIRDILDGRIVPRRFGNRIDGVLTDSPQPPVVDKPKILRMYATPGAIGFEPPRHANAPRLPSFSTAFQDAMRWDPDAKKARTKRA